MDYTFSTLFKISLRFYFLLTPFFALSMFLYLTKNFSDKRRKSDATKIAITTFICCVIIIFFGETIFSVLGITLDAFRTGVGTILLLDAISLVKGRIVPPQSDSDTEEIVIVPMTIPILIGPAVMGTMLVLGIEAPSLNAKLFNIIALLIALFVIWAMLYLSVAMEKYLGKKRIVILSKITGIYLAALASQMIMQGLRDNFFVK
ncbi:MAG: MarC family protein [Bdellovibrionota bacterium]